MKLVYLVLATATLLPATSRAKWKPQYASAPQEVQDWYKSRKLTDAAAKRFAFKSCCDGSDKVETQFRVDRATGEDRWYYQKDGQWVEVPPDVEGSLNAIKSAITSVNEFITSTAAAVEEQSIVTQDMSTNMQKASAELAARSKPREY